MTTTDKTKAYEAFKEIRHQATVDAFKGFGVLIAISATLVGMLFVGPFALLPALGVAIAYLYSRHGRS